MQFHTHDADHRSSSKYPRVVLEMRSPQMHKLKEASAQTCMLNYTCLSMRVDTHARAKPFTTAAGGRSHGSACGDRLVGGTEGKHPPPSGSPEVRPPELQQQSATKQPFPAASLRSRSKRHRPAGDYPTRNII